MKKDMPANLPCSSKVCPVSHHFSREIPLGFREAGIFRQRSTKDILNLLGVVDLYPLWPRRVGGTMPKFVQEDAGTGRCVCGGYLIDIARYELVTDYFLNALAQLPGFFRFGPVGVLEDDCVHSHFGHLWE